LRFFLFDFDHQEKNMLAALRSSSYQGVVLRTATKNDSELLYQVFLDSRIDLMLGITGWEQQQQDAFMYFQFNTQLDQYQKNYVDARFDVIVAEGNVIGNIYTAQTDGAIHLVDISLLPEQRNRGIGQALIQDLLDEATRIQKDVTLHVQQGNPAIHLYLRLGFFETGEQGIYKRMEWLPSSARTTKTIP